MNDELGFEHLTKRHLVRFCKKFHKDCYRLVGQKMKLKDKLREARAIILMLYNAGRDVLMYRNEEKAYTNLDNAINDKSIEQFIEETE